MRAEQGAFGSACALAGDARCTRSAVCRRAADAACAERQHQRRSEMKGAASQSRRLAGGWAPVRAQVLPASPSLPLSTLPMPMRGALWPPAPRGVSIRCVLGDMSWAGATPERGGGGGGSGDNRTGARGGCDVDRRGSAPGESEEAAQRGCVGCGVSTAVAASRTTIAAAGAAGAGAGRQQRQPQPRRAVACARGGGARSPCCHEEGRGTCGGGAACLGRGRSSVACTR